MMRKVLNSRKNTWVCVVALVLYFLACHHVEAAVSDIGAQRQLSQNPVNNIVPAADNSNDPDYSAASLAISNLITTYSSFLGNTTAGVQTNTYGYSGNYYTQWFTNGMALMAWVDGYVYLYYAGSWQKLSVIWNSEIANVYLLFETTIYQYSSFFGSPSGSMIRGTSNGQNFYAMSFKNGIVLLAATDGNMYYYLGGTWKYMGETWKTTP